MAKNVKEIQAAYDAVNRAFHGDKKLVFIWFNTKNTNLGGDTPLDLIKANKVKKLLSFVTSPAFPGTLK